MTKEIERVVDECEDSLRDEFGQAAIEMYQSGVDCIRDANGGNISDAGKGMVAVFTAFVGRLNRIVGNDIEVLSLLAQFQIPLTAYIVTTERKED